MRDFAPAVDYPLSAAHGLAERTNMMVGDVNGDGHPDVVVATHNYYSANVVSVMLANADGSLQPGTAYQTGDWIGSAALADIDRDGALDIVLAGEERESFDPPRVLVRALRGHGDGRFDAPHDIATGVTSPFGVFSVAVGDIDGDLWPDIALSVEQIAVLFNRGDGVMRHVVGPYVVRHYPRDLIITDVNRDGRPDLVAADVVGVSVFLGQGNGAFANPVSYDAQGDDDGSGSALHTLVAGDLNGDGFPDLVASIAIGNGNDGPDRGVILMNDGAGGFRHRTPIVGYTSGPGLAVADLNGDGKNDLAVAERGYDNGGSSVVDGKTVSIFIGNGDGTFGAPRSYPVARTPTAIVVADFNGDGKNDIAVVSLDDQKVSMLLGTCR